MLILHGYLSKFEIIHILNAQFLQTFSVIFNFYSIIIRTINCVSGCENIVTTPRNVGQAPPVDFIVSDTAGCVPALFQFTNTAENPGSILQWDFGDGTISNEQGVTDHYYNEAGCYDVTLTAPNGCPNSITYENMVCAYNIPIAGFIINDHIQYSDVNEFIFDNFSQYGYTCFWNLGDNTVTKAVSPGCIYPIERNIYQVMLVTTNEAGCSDTTYSSVQVKERLIFYVPNSFTPDGNNRNESFQAIFTAGYERRTFELFIFNQWGETMFESYNENVGWDGTYIWKIRFRLLDDSEFKEYFRHVNVLR